MSWPSDGSQLAAAPVYATATLGTAAASGATSLVLDAAPSPTPAAGMLISGGKLPAGAKVVSWTAGTKTLVVDSPLTGAEAIGAVYTITASSGNDGTVSAADKLKLDGLNSNNVTPPTFIQVAVAATTNAGATTLTLAAAPGVTPVAGMKVVGFGIADGATVKSWVAGTKALELSAATLLTINATDKIFVRTALGNDGRVTADQSQIWNRIAIGGDFSLSSFNWAGQYMGGHSTPLTNGWYLRSLKHDQSATTGEMFLNNAVDGLILRQGIASAAGKAARNSVRMWCNDVQSTLEFNAANAADTETINNYTRLYCENNSFRVNVNGVDKINYGSSYLRFEYSSNNFISINSGSITLSTGSGSSGAQVTSNSLIPYGDNYSSLGASSNRWTLVYAVNATINTSDQREKTPLQALPDRLLDIWFDHVRIGQWRWLEQDNGWHVGFIAQDVIAAFDAAGLDWRDWFSVQQDAETGRLSISMPEILTIEAAAVRRKLGV